MREIATLQIGGYANYVGAHFWNFQDEILGIASNPDADAHLRQPGLDMDVLYRTGETRQGAATYTPRLIAIDLRGSLGAARSRGSLYDSGQTSGDAAVHTWSGPVSVHREEPVESSEFQKRLEADTAGEEFNLTDQEIVQKLDERVEFWTDYLKSPLHPRSVYEIEGVWSKISRFESFGDGKGLFSRPERIEEFQDRCRFFVEECDHLQGVQAIVDDSGGFSGVASDLLTAFEDEYGDIPLILFTVRPPEAESRSVIRSLHDAVSFASLSSFGDIVVPIGLPQLSQRGAFARDLIIDDAKLFHTSAVYAGSLHNATLPFRMMDLSTQVGGCNVEALVKGLSSATRNIAHLSAALPSPSLPDDPKRGFDMSALVDLTPEVALASTEDYAAESFVVQGARLAGSRGPATLTQVMNSLSIEKQKRTSVALTHIACSPCPLALPLPFPEIFRESVSSDGDLLQPSSSRSPNASVFSVPVATRLKTDRAIEPYLRRRLRDLEQLGLKRKAPVLQDWELERDDVEELREGLATTLSRYADGADLDSS